MIQCAQTFLKNKLRGMGAANLAVYKIAKSGKLVP